MWAHVLENFLTSWSLLVLQTHKTSGCLFLPYSICVLNNRKQSPDQPPLTNTNRIYSLPCHFSFSLHEGVGISKNIRFSLKQKYVLRLRKFSFLQNHGLCFRYEEVDVYFFFLIWKKLPVAVQGTSSAWQAGLGVWLGWSLRQPEQLLVSSPNTNQILLQLERPCQALEFHEIKASGWRIGSNRN